MKKFAIGFITCLVLSIPIFALSAPNLAERLKGRILLAVEDRGKTYFVHEDGNRYHITKQTAQKVFEKLALGITNEDLGKIPLNDVGIETETQTAECLPEVVERLTYIDRPGECDYKKYTDEIQILREEILTLGIDNENLNNQILGNNTNISTIDSLNRDYGLRINTIELEILKITELKEYDYYDLREIYYNSNGRYSASNPSPISGQFEIGILEKMFVDGFQNIGGSDLRRNCIIFLSAENETRRDEIALLRNELQRKLLELE